MLYCCYLWPNEGIGETVYIPSLCTYLTFVLRNVSEYTLSPGQVKTDLMIHNLLKGLSYIDIKLQIYLMISFT